MAGINLQQTQWRNIVFDGRNQEYGAYKLRQFYTKRSVIAILIGVFIVAFLASAPILASVIKNSMGVKDVKVDMNTELANVEIEKIEELPPPPDIPPPPPAVKEIKFTAPDIVEQEKIKKEDIPPPAETIKEDAILGDETKEGLSKFDVPIDAPEDGEGDAIVGTVIDNKVYSYASIQVRPQFPGGMAALYKYLQKNFNYPQRARELGIEGTVWVQFTIEKDGSVSSVKTIRGKELGGGLAKEAERVVRSLPNWSPGEQNGRSVRVSYQIPIEANLN